MAGLFTVAIAGVFAGAAQAQQVGRITGRVTDASSGGPLGEVQVYIAGANTGALSRQDGRS
jgi:hypothetical protein